MKSYLLKAKVNITDWLAQSPDLNPAENLWDKLKTKVFVRRPSNLEELERFAREQARTTQEICVRAKQTTENKKDTWLTR